MSRGTAFVRQPSSRLAEGLITYLARTPVDLERARAQHAAYCAALGETGWQVQEVEPADSCPDSVFIEDAMVVCDRLAVITRPGAPTRLAETAGAEAAARAAGLDVVRIQEPGTLDGGDVLQAGATVYVGRGGRSNAEGICQLQMHVEPLGRQVVPVGLRGVLHLKSAMTALPDGTLIAAPDYLDTSALPTVRAVDEESGCHVVPLGEDLVLLAASAPRTAGMLRGLGFTPVVVDISEFEKLEGCVTCLCVLASTG
ncbi:MAG: dimethylargininase [Micromonosporaceae bacterium]